MPLCSLQHDRVFKKLLYDNKRQQQDPPVKQNMIRSFMRRSSEPLNDLRSRKKGVSVTSASPVSY